MHHALPDDPHSSPADVLRWLMEVNGMKQVDLAKVLGVTSGRASEIANGVRDLSKAQILMLADHFRVRADLFLAKKSKASPQVKGRAASSVKYTSKVTKAVTATRGIKESSKVNLAKPKKTASQTRKSQAK